MAIIKRRRIFVTVINTFIIPQIKTIDKASCHEKFKLKITVYVKNAFNPIPGASAYGTFAIKPIARVEIAEAKIVAKNTACAGIPPSARIDGLTNRI